ncbi:hypothetical protein RHDE110596_21390 [Prescottella defluvii]
MIPALVMLGAAVGVLTQVVFGLMYPRSPAAYWTPTIIVGVAVPAAMYAWKRRQLTNDYASKRLVLSPSGLTRSDRTTITEIPLHGIDRVRSAPTLVVRKASSWASPQSRAVAGAGLASARSAEALAITGRGVVYPVPGASQVVLATHDQSLGSRLQDGQPYSTPTATIIPSEFEDDWRHGTIGAWMRQYRPDVPLA